MLEWKLAAHTSTPKSIDYFFYAASGVDLAEFESQGASLDHARLNFEEFRLSAPSEAKFDSTLKLRLLLENDGTATASFVFRDGSHAKNSDIIKARPFHIDMTSSRKTDEAASKAYVGLDFGSSNTALATISAMEVERYRSDAKDKGWIELTDLSDRLPLPIASPLSLYIAESGDVAARSKRARQTIESTLSLLIGVVMADSQYVLGNKKGGAQHGPIKSFATSRVSAGPLWSSLREYSKILKKESTFSSPVHQLFTGSAYDIVNQSITWVGQCKHDKCDESAVDWNKSLAILGNVSKSVFEKVKFGFFTNSAKRASKFQSNFRTLHGTGFGDSGLKVILNEMPDDSQPYILVDAKVAIPMFPWLLFEAGGDSAKRSILFYDGRGKSGHEYRTPTNPSMVILDNSDELSLYAHSATQLLSGVLEGPVLNITDSD
jgi:hypothetical protein